MVVVARNGAVIIPPKYAGMSLEEVKEKVCGTCLEISDEQRRYCLAFYTLKIGLVLAQLIAVACRQRGG